MVRGRSLRILWFNWRCWLNPQAGGAEVHVKEIAKRWVKLGHEITLFCGKYHGCKEHEELEGVEVIRKGYQYSVYLFAAKEYIFSLRKRNYSIVIDDINGVPFFTPLYVREHKIAIMHHLVKDIFFKELPFDKAILGYAAERIIPLVYRNIPFLAVSDSTKQDLAHFGIPQRGIKIVHNGIDHEVFTPELRRKSSYPHVVYVGRIKRYKNLDHLIIAFSLLVNRLKTEGRSNKLTIAGKGDYIELKGLAKRLGVESQVDFLGEISDEEKVRLLQSAWVFVTTSTREGWGLTTVEAMACGTPVIAYNVPGLTDSSLNGKTGFLVPYGKTDEMTECLAQVLCDELLRKELSMNATNWARQFNWDKTAKESMDFLKSHC